MVVVLQRVTSAKVSLKSDPVRSASIGEGYALLVGVAAEDSEDDARRLAAQVAKVRLMEDADGRMGRRLGEAGGEVLAVSQFTLLADFSKGNRPSFHRAARPKDALPLFALFVRSLSDELGIEVRTGFFGEDMTLEIVNDGPVTVVLY